MHGKPWGQKHNQQVKQLYVLNVVKGIVIVVKLPCLQTMLIQSCIYGVDLLPGPGFRFQNCAMDSGSGFCFLYNLRLFLSRWILKDTANLTWAALTWLKKFLPSLNYCLISSQSKLPSRFTYSLFNAQFWCNLPFIFSRQLILFGHQNTKTGIRKNPDNHAHNKQRFLSKFSISPQFFNAFTSQSLNVENQ